MDTGSTGAGGTAAVLAGLLVLGGCSGDRTGRGDGERAADRADLETHTVIYGGDFTLGRRINEALWDPQARDRIFGDVEPLLREADLALINAEGVIAQGGYFNDKGEPRPYLFRAHPAAIDVLTRAGIDLVTVGNNHAVDYGPAALTEMLDRLTLAGIDYFGGGHDAADARRPAYRRLGDTVVAFVGADFTVSAKYRAGRKRAGILYYDAFRDGSREDGIVADLKKIHDEARRHAQVVLLSPHWGDNMIDRPAPHLRSLARRLIDVGYDGILGHSAHVFQGVELIDGKPVIYDAGNLVADFGGGGRVHQALAWELEITRAGVTRLAGYPLQLERNRTDLATGDLRGGILEDLAGFSAELGTELAIEDGVARLACDPGGVRGPKAAAGPPARAAVADVRLAPNDTLIDALPARAIPLEARFEGGVRLLGYEVLLSELPTPKAGQVIVLYFTADEPLKESYHVSLEGKRVHDGKPGGTSVEAHLPGDWLLPTTEWAPGRIVRDWTLLRLTFDAAGTVDFHLGLTRAGKPVAVTGPDGSIEGNKVRLGRAAFRDGAPGVFAVLERYRRHFERADGGP
jgi:poly-gamma-glutamate capsule biosynthesis protein CapA/YwtB (metallophosphatase superfamily)